MDMRNRLEAVLGAPIRGFDRLGASFAGDLYRIASPAGEFALKWAERPTPGALAAEGRGLQVLGTTGSIRVPHVHTIADPSAAGNPGPAFLLIEWLSGGGAAPNMADLGAHLAALHRHSNPTYGLDHANYIGGTPQPNAPHTDWIVFFREQRLMPQIDRAARNGLLPGNSRRALETVLDRLADLLAGAARTPALIHGDLWSGNVLAADSGGTPAIIDPAVYYADREAEIAFTNLFGGFGPHFYAAYNEAWPLEPGFNQRRDLYNLYHLLNHLNLFGESYGSQIDTIARRYA
ncbi:MAG: fructosamine kinase family protein [Oscillochloris sp.]|nr:fructosamine kinase family protein [Oscillochloris sp.]